MEGKDSELRKQVKGQSVHDCNYQAFQTDDRVICLLVSGDPTDFIFQHMALQAFQVNPPIQFSSPPEGKCHVHSNQTFFLSSSQLIVFLRDLGLSVTASQFRNVKTEFVVYLFFIEMSLHAHVEFVAKPHAVNISQLRLLFILFCTACYSENSAIHAKFKFPVILQLV